MYSLVVKGVVTPRLKERCPVADGHYILRDECKGGKINGDGQESKNIIKLFFDQCFAECN